MPGEFHPDFFADTGVGQRGTESVPERVKCPFGEVSCAFAAGRLRIDTRFQDDPLESLT